MAMRAVNLLGLQAPHRAAAASQISPLCVNERIGAAPVGWRSSCGAALVGPYRLSQQPCSTRCAATASPASPTAWSMDTDCEEVMGRLRDTEQLTNCLGARLTDEEQRSLIKCLDSARLGVDTCLVDGLPALREHMLSYIEAVSVSQTDDLELVEGAMLLIEQLSLVLGSTAFPPAAAPPPPPPPPASPTAHAELLQGSGEGQSGAASERFSGQWQVLVTTGGGWPYGRLQYVPIFELLDISEDGRHFRLESKAGQLYTSASGDVTWRREPDHLHYHVTEFRAELFGLALTLPAPTPDNDLRVFAVSPSGATALARSSLGGMQLMGRPL
ncbi:hypothetical protein PLESTF_000472300 [Pleodorina starrii]|nr:hypothetical protein PLESTM_001766700 [Pleodorina starrii]GLC66767.1 hypothetical protein PLESTF_000472300 [Pleodorina starrii]